LLTERTSDRRNEIKLVYKLSNGEAQQILLEGSDLQDNTGFQIHISRYPVINFINPYYNVIIGLDLPSD